MNPMRAASYFQPRMRFGPVRSRAWVSAALLVLAWLCLGILASHPVGAQANGGLLHEEFYQDFSQGLPADWTFSAKTHDGADIPDAWVVRDAVLYQDSDGSDASAVGGDPQWENYTLDVRIMIRDCTNQQATILVRDEKVGDSHQNYRILLDAKHDEVNLGAQMPGYTEMAKAACVLELNTWYDVRVRAFDNEITVSVDNREILRGTDGYRRRLAGGIGFCTSLSRIAIDWIRVVPMRLSMQPHPDLEKDAAWRGPEPDLADEDDYIRLENDEFAAYISRETGLLVGLVSKLPTPVPIIAPGSRGLRLYADNMDTGRLTILDQAVSAPQLEETADGPVIRAQLGGEGEPLARAEVEYRLSGDGLSLSARLRFERDNPSTYRVGMHLIAALDQWPNESDVMGEWPSNSRRVTQYSYAAGMLDGAKWGMAGYPMGALSREDRILLFGDPDLAAYYAIAPNFYPNSVPCLLVQPEGVKPGQEIGFHLLMKTFPRPPNRFEDALRWYGRHLVFSDPDVPGPVALTEQRYRTIPPGLIVGYTNDHSPLMDFEPPETIEELEAKMLKMHMTNLWYYGWDSWRETEPTLGDRWYNFRGLEWTPEKLRAEIKRLQAKGFHVFLYFRQGVWLRQSELDSPDEMPHPPYKRFLNRRGQDIRVVWRQPTGGPDVYDPGLSEAGELDPEETILGCELDFTNPETRAWYLNRMKAAIEMFDPDGVALDQGWGFLQVAFNDKQPAAYDPNSDNFQGFFKLQMEFYRWLHENYPDKRVLQNFGMGAPSQIFADAEIKEGGIASPDDRFAQIGRAYLSVVSNYQDPALQIEMHHVPRDQAERNIVSGALMGLGAGAPWGGFLPFSLIEHSLTEHSGACHKLYGTWASRIPVVDTLQTVADLSAEVTAMPLVYEPGALTFDQPKIYGTAWAAGNRLRLAIYNANADTTRFEFRLSRAILGRYGIDGDPALRFTVLDSNAQPKPQTDFEPAFASESFGGGGSLEPGELLLVYGGAE